MMKQWRLSSLIVIHAFYLAMASSTLESTAAFAERAKAIGVEQWIIQKFQEKSMDTYGRFAFVFIFNPILYRYIYTTFSISLDASV